MLIHALWHVSITHSFHHPYDALLRRVNISNNGRQLLGSVARPMCTAQRSIPRTMNAGRNVCTNAQHTAWSARHLPTASPAGWVPRNALPPSQLATLSLGSHCSNIRECATRAAPSRVQSRYSYDAARDPATTGIIRSFLHGAYQEASSVPALISHASRRVLA